MEDIREKRMIMTHPYLVSRIPTVIAETKGRREHLMLKKLEPLFLTQTWKTLGEGKNDYDSSIS